MMQSLTVASLAAADAPSVLGLDSTGQPGVRPVARRR
jgi:hypothetical protein